MRKINPLQKFFQDYPIIWIFVIIIAIAWTLGYLFSGFHKTELPQIEKPKSAEIKVVQPLLVAKPQREVKITPVATTAIPRKQESSPVIASPKGAKQSQSEIASVVKIVKPKIAFVIDDLGYNKRQAELLFSIDHPLTIAILPQLPHSRYFAEEGKNHGFDTILHQPLEPENQNEDPGPGLIKADMTVEQVQEILEKNLSTVPGVIGVNNHMGSRATRDRRLMYLVAKEIKHRNLFFLDSLTHSQSIAHDVTFALGIPTVKRDVFLDNEDVYESIVERIKETAEIAKQNGKAVAIGHIRQNTLQAIKDTIPNLEAEGFEITTLKELLK